MKKVLLLILLPILFSCESEYEERLGQARVLKMRMDKIEELERDGENPNLYKEIQAIHSEILFLSKVSGNEEKFLREVYQD